MSRRILQLAALVLLFAAVPLAAQQHPNQQKGFDATKLYSFEGLDTINTFNGNLVVSLQIGQKYSGDGNLAYGFSLVYNGRPWEARGHGEEYLEGIPDRRSNAGMGWLFSMGRLIPPGDETNQTVGYNHASAAFIYETPDGNEVKMMAESNLSATNAYLFVDEASPNFIRMKRVTITERELHFPDGTIHTFVDMNSGKSPANWRLRYIRDAFRNQVEIKYSTTGAEVWTIEQSRAGKVIRTHTATFTEVKDPTVTFKQTLLDKLEVEGFNGQKVVYDFNYDNPVSLARPAWDNYDKSPPVKVYLLKSVTLGGTGENYAFSYYGDGATEKYPGWMKKLTLPTGGGIRWTYEDRYFPEGSGAINEVLKPNYSNIPRLQVARETNIGVATRHLVDADGNDIGTPWRYTHSMSGAEECTINWTDPITRIVEPKTVRFHHQVVATVTDPSGATHVNYYHTWVVSQYGRCDGHDKAFETTYGLPLTLAVPPDASGKYLSTEVRTNVNSFEGGEYGNGRMDPSTVDKALRSTWVTYESQLRPAQPVHLETARRTYFEQDKCSADGKEACYTEAYNFNWDERGHFRQTSSGSNFGDKPLTGSGFTAGTSNFTTEFTNYTKRDEKATYWTLNNYTERCTVDDPSLRTTAVDDCSDLTALGTVALDPLVQTFCFSDLGFLERARTLANGATAGDGDILVRFTSDTVTGNLFNLGGNVGTEEYFGGDLKEGLNDPYDRGDAAAPPDGCDAKITQTPRYKITHEYFAGVRTKTQYAGVSFLSLDQDVDPGTGLVTKARDTAKLETVFDYHPWGRPKTVTAPGVAQVVYRFTPYDATKKKNATVEVEQDAGAPYGKTLALYEYDPLGRVIREESLLANGTDKSVRRTKYDVLGRKEWMSELEKLTDDTDKSDPAYKTTFVYDVFNRARTVTAADGAKTQFNYTGEGTRHMQRTVEIATSRDGAPTAAVTHEVYDPQGRLWKVKEPSGPTSVSDPTGDYVVTTYGYDAGDRLTSVEMKGAADDGTQNRRFEYDNRGFLLWEQHPEKGEDGNGKVSYSRYDPRGHAWRKIEGEKLGKFDLQYEYDAAERLLLVARKKSATEVDEIKKMEYSSAADKSLGKLHKATRHNALDIGDVTVTETYGYDEPAGRMATRTTAVANAGTPIQTFSQSFKYSPFGQVETIGYPKCETSACAGSPSIGSVQNVFRNGYLTSIEGFADVSYWPNGLVHQVTHKSATAQTVGIDTQEADDSGIARPKSIKFEGFCRGPELSATYPENQTQWYGTTVQLSIPAVAGATQYQWYEVTSSGALVLLPNQLNKPYYDLPSLATTKRYLVRVSDATCSSDSRIATVEVPCSDVVVRAMPKDYPMNAGTPARFSVDAYSPTNKKLIYQWYRGAKPEMRYPVGNGSKELVTEPLYKRERYWLRITIEGNSSCVVDSPTVEAIVCNTPAIVSQPQDSIVDITGGKTPAAPSATMIVEGEPPFVYRVYRNGALIQTRTENSPIFTYTRENIAKGSEEYEIEVQSCTNLPPARSRKFVLGAKECAAPKFYVYGPAGMIELARAGNVVELIAYPDPYDDWNSGKYTYTWYRNGEALNVNQNRINATGYDDGAVYYVRMTNTECGMSVESPRSYLYSYGSCPMRDVTVTPTRAVLAAGETTTLQANVDWGDIRYEWYKGMPGDTSRPKLITVPGRPDQLSVSGAEPAIYWVRAINRCGETRDSQAVYVERTNCGPIAIRGITQDRDIASGDPVELAVDATSNPAPSRIVWFYDPKNPTSISPSSYRVTVAPKETTTYWAYVETPCFARAESPYVTLHVRSCGTSHFTEQPPAVVETDNRTPVTLKVASNDPSVKFEWFYGDSGDTSKPVGNTSDTLTTPVLSENVKYWARATTASGCKFDSRTILVDVCILPAVKKEPVRNRNAVAGELVWIGFSYEGNKLKYEWYQGLSGDVAHSTLLGHTTPLALVSVLQTTPFWVRVSNRCGSADSETYWVSICPTIAQEPKADKTTVMPGTTTKLSVVADGTGLTYQWWQGTPGIGTKLGTGATIDSPPITADTEFYVEVTSGKCTRTFGPVKVELCKYPTITGVSAQREVTAGFQQFLTILASPTANTQFTYYEGESGKVSESKLLSGPTVNSAVPISPMVTTSYWIRVTNGDCYTDSATITVKVCIPRIVTDAPETKLAVSGEPLDLHVAADGGALTYQWYEGVPGDTSRSTAVQHASATTDTLRIAASSAKTYWVRIAGECSAISSRGTAVTLCDAPKILPLSRPVIDRLQGATLNATATGTALEFTWYEGPLGSTNEISRSASFTVFPRTTTKYWVKVKGMCGEASAETLVSVRPIITTPPSEQRVTSGSPAVFQIEVDADPIAYAWFQVAANGTTTAVGDGTKRLVTQPLTIDSEYFVRLTSGDAVVESARVKAHVCAPPEIRAENPQSTSGAMVTLFALTRDSAGQGSSTFHWYEGESGNTDKPLGSSPNNYRAVYPDVTTKYWVREQWDTCSADSASVEVVVCKPRITAQASKSAADANGQVKLSVSAVGTPQLVYQWYTGAPGQTNTLVGTGREITITPAASSYWVRVTSGAGASCFVDSDAVTFTLCEPPAIQQQPAPANYRRQGPAALLSITATGTNPHYQWFEGAVGDTSKRVGTDSASFGATPFYTAQYWVRVSNDCGSIDSAAVLVSTYPVITQEPSSPPISQGSSATLTVIADAQPIAYQWYQGDRFDTRFPVGTNSATFVTPPLSGATTYWVRVTSGTASTDSQAVTPGFCRKPDAYVDVQTGVSGERAVIYVRDPNPNGDEAYHWYEGSTPGDVANSRFITNSGYLPYLQIYPTETTTYWVREQRANCYGDSAAVTVRVFIPAITQQPAGTTGITTPGTAVPLSVRATGTAPLTYQWYVGNKGETGNPILGATSRDITVTPMTTTRYWVRVSHFDGQTKWNADSETAEVQICTAPSISQQPTSPPGVHNGSLSGATVQATGDSLSYQWYRGQSGDTSNLLTGQTEASLVINVWETAWYWVRVSNPCGHVDSVAIQLSVFPQISDQPDDEEVNPGSRATLTIVASGKDLVYQWYRVVNNGAPVKVGTNAPTYITDPVNGTTQYFVTIASGRAEVQSRVATVGLCTGPRLERDAMVSLLVSGCKVVDVVVAFEDRGSVTYRWYEGLSGDTSKHVRSSSYHEVCPLPAQPTPFWCRITFGDDGCYTDSQTVYVSQ